MDDRPVERLDNLTTLIALHALPLLRRSDDQMRRLAWVARLGLILSMLSTGLTGVLLWAVFSQSG